MRICTKGMSVVVRRSAKESYYSSPKYSHHQHPWIEHELIVCFGLITRTNRLTDVLKTILVVAAIWLLLASNRIPSFPRMLTSFTLMSRFWSTGARIWKFGISKAKRQAVKVSSQTKRYTENIVFRIFLCLK